MTRIKKQPTEQNVSHMDAKLERRASQGRAAKSRKARAERRDKKVGLPAVVVFWLVAPLGVAGVALPVAVDFGWVYLTLSAIVVQIGILMLNDQRGFSRSREMRRAYESRRHFSILETIVLFLLIMADMLAAAYAILMAAAP